MKVQVKVLHLVSLTSNVEGGLLIAKSGWLLQISNRLHGSSSFLGGRSVSLCIFYSHHDWEWELIMATRWWWFAFWLQQASSDTAPAVTGIVASLLPEGRGSPSSAWSSLASQGREWWVSYCPVGMNVLTPYSEFSDIRWEGGLEYPTTAWKE